ncbi:aminotransferase class V-fold PLP-dependent enzyme [Pelagihabitans pacificus]|nr:aminotransferase class V-fold PLP-dependent enzyme [Pelagihabitans pacificus]
MRKQFPVLSQCIYANTAASGLLYDGLLEWRQEHDLDFLIGGSRMKMKAMIEGIPEIRKRVGHFFNCKVENVALVPNFSLGLNMLLDGLDSKHRILLIESDYPSVNWPFEDRGFQVSYAKLDADLEANILEKVKSDDISVLALSIVQWVNGIQIDMDFLATLKKEFPNLLIIADGTQFCGMTDFDFEASPLDIMGTSAYKWLLAGYGNGFMFFKDGVEDRIALQSTGFNAANGNVDGKDNVRFAKRLEPGHLDTLNFGSLKFSLEFLNGIGMKTIERRLEVLSKKAKTAFTELGLLEESVVGRSSHSTIFNIKGDDALFQKFVENDVVCSQRGGGIRLSFHFYNTEAEIDAIVRILKTG